MNEANKFEQWAIVEVMGHRRFAGLVSEQTIGGASFVRVDVPEVKDTPAFTKFFGAGSIYCISPVSESIARGLAAQWREAPVSVYDLPAEYKQQRLGLERSDEDYDDEMDDEPICRGCGVRLQTFAGQESGLCEDCVPL